MTDGYCASTCIIFVELMKRQGVRSIVFGGRPNHGPMQTLGGVKGGQSWSISLISLLITHAYELAVNSLKIGSPILTPEELTRFEMIAPPNHNNFSLRFDMHGGSYVNFRNAYNEGDDLTPLQFVYEAAECRLFYTTENVARPASVWLAAANAMWDKWPCIHGSTNASGSLEAFNIKS